MSTETLVQPVFDPSNAAASLDFIEAQLPIGRGYRLGFVAGNSESRLRGEGSQVRNIRDYRMGDDTRHIDHRLSAKSPDGQLKVREFNRDINPDFWVVTDSFQSGYDAVTHPSEYYTKQRLALAGAMGLLVMASQQGLPFTVVGANDNSIGLLGRPLKGRSHLGNLAEAAAETMSVSHNLEQLLSATPDTPITRPRFYELVRYASDICSNGIVALVSDFRDASPDDADHGWKQALDDLRDKNNQIIAVDITSPSNTSLPKTKRLATEQGVVVIGGGKLGQAQRLAYEKAVTAEDRLINKALAGVNAQRIRLSTTDATWLDSFIDQISDPQSISI